LVCTITTRSGESYSVGHDSSYVTHVAEYDGSIIPAHRGYSVIRATLSGGEWQYELFPVVGWSKLQIEDHAYDALFRSAPIVAGAVGDTYAWDLVLPDGRVISKTKSVYKNIEEWFDNEKATRLDQRKEKIAPAKNRILPKWNAQISKREPGVSARLLRKKSKKEVSQLRSFGIEGAERRAFPKSRPCHNYKNERREVPVRQ